MESLTDYGYSGMNNGTKVHHFLQGIKSSELEALANVVCAQPEKYGTDFNATISHEEEQLPNEKSASEA